MPFYTKSELRDLLILIVQTYEEDLKKEPLTKEEIAAVNDWVFNKADTIIEHHNDYLIYLSQEADSHDWEHGDIGGY